MNTRNFFLTLLLFAFHSIQGQVNPTAAIKPASGENYILITRDTFGAARFVYDSIQFKISGDTLYFTDSVFVDLSSIIESSYPNPNRSTTNNITGVNSRGEGLELEVTGTNSTAQGYQDTVLSNNSHAIGNQIYIPSGGIGRYGQGINLKMESVTGNHQKFTGVANYMFGETDGSVIYGGYQDTIYKAFNASIFSCKSCRIGDDQELSNYSSILGGDKNRILGQSFLSVVLGGRENVIWGDVLSMYSSHVGGRGKWMIGHTPYAASLGGWRSVLTGGGAITLGGDSLRVYSRAELASGRYNISDSSGDPVNFVSTNFLQTIGNGDINARSNSLTRLTNGFTQINTTGFGVGLTLADVTPAGALEVVSTTGAFIPPRMTTTQRNALTIVDGSIVVDTTLDSIFYYLGGSWNAIGSSNVLSFSNPSLSIDGGATNVDISNINHWTKEGDGDLTYSDNTKQIGIGTNNPSHTLDIKDNGNAEINVQRVGGAALRFQSQAARGMFGTFSNHPFDIVANSTLKMRMLTNGFVSIGAISPAVELHAADAFANAASFMVTNSATGHATTDGTRITTNVLNSSIKNQENGTFDIWTNGVQQIQLKADGNLELGSSVTSNTTTILNKFKLDHYGSGGNTGTVSKYLAVETDGDIIETDIANLYSVDGTLTGNRTITMSTNDLTIQGINGSNVNSSSFDNNINSFSITNGTSTTTLEHRATGLDLKLNHFKIINDNVDQLYITDNETNSTTKKGSIVTPHYNNSEEPFLWLTTQAGSTFNSLRFGGGNSKGNAATVIDFHTAANNTTTTGKRQMRITADGTIEVSELINLDPQSSVPSSPSTGDIYMDDGTNITGSTPTLRYYNGTSWIDLN